MPFFPFKIYLCWRLYSWISSKSKNSIEYNISETKKFKNYDLEGTFTDNYGNIGTLRAVIIADIEKGKLLRLDATSENIKAYNTAKRANNELKQGVGKWYFTYASKSINAIINSECIYSIRYYKDNFLTLGKCEVPEKAFEQIKNISK